MAKQRKPVADGYRDKVIVVCASCKKEFETSDYGLLCDAILARKPACSYECNKALGQVDK